jgi:hypothetical protein
MRLGADRVIPPTRREVARREGEAMPRLKRRVWYYSTRDSHLFFRGLLAFYSIVNAFSGRIQ